MYVYASVSDPDCNHNIKLSMNDETSIQRNETACHFCLETYCRAEEYGSMLMWSLRFTYKKST